MASNVVTFSGTSVIPTQYSNQRNMDDCSNGVKWAALIDGSTLRFYHSIDNGATWSQNSSEAISSCKASAGVDMEIAVRPDGAERIAVGYIRHDQLHIAFGKFNNSRTDFTWIREGVHASSSHSTWRYPSIKVIPLDYNWWVHPAWVKFSSSRSYIYLQVVKFYGSSSYSVLYERYTHNITSSQAGRPCWGYRHKGSKDKINTGQPDLYLAWFSGTISDSSTNRKCYNRKFSYSGSSWREETLRTIKTNTVSSGLLDSCFTGKVFATVVAPADDPTNIELFTMNPGDTERELIEVPSMNQDAITSIGVTWDNFTGDIWIVAAGTASRAPRLIKYLWGSRTFTTWSQINSDAALNDSIALKQGSSGNRVEMLYVVNSSNNSLVKYELVGVTNVPPTQPPWVTNSGAYNVNDPFTFEWIHTDLDGDPQVAYALRRTNDAGTGFDHWNGSSWQSSWTSVTSSVQSVTRPSGWQADITTKQYQAQTFDGQEWSAWNDPITITGSIPNNPTITSPANLATIIHPLVTITWTVDEQLAYLIEVLSASGAVVYTSGWIPDETARELELSYLLVNLESYTLRIHTQNNEGLISDPDSVEIDALFDPPPLPIFTVVPLLESRSFLINITTPDPVGTEPATDHNNIYVDLDESGDLIRVATSIEPNGSFEYYPRHGQDVEFMVESVSAAGAINQAT